MSRPRPSTTARPGRVVDAAASGLGVVLSALTTLLGRSRCRARPLHPVGTVRRATVHRAGCASTTGVPLVDEPGTTPAVVRLSRAVGLPARLPDVLGLALRVDTPEGPGDLLLATTGSGRWGRFLLSPRIRVVGATFCTLMPFRSPTGPLLLGAHVPRGASTCILSVARPRGPWVAFGRVEVHDDERLGSEEDPIVSFDPVLHQVPGLGTYDWAALLRRRAYRAARRTREGRGS